MFCLGWTLKLKFAITSTFDFCLRLGVVVWRGQP